MKWGAKAELLRIQSEKNSGVCRDDPDEGGFTAGEEAYAWTQAVEQNCGYSTSHFMRWIRQLTGTTFIVYLNGLRLPVAAERPHRSSDISLFLVREVGVEDLFDFNRRFKDCYGVMPGNDRRNGIKTA